MAGVLIGLTVLAACGPTTNGAQAPTTAVTTTTQPAQPTTPAYVPLPTTVPTKAPPAVVAKFVPANIYAATCGITKPPAPTHIQVSCDSTADLRQATWSTWNNEHADGRGDLALNNCEPDCALGKYTLYPVSIHFDTPGQSKCGTIWEHVVFTFLGTPPNGAKALYLNGPPVLQRTTNPADVVNC
ncbi:MAG TPA: hypothetical protein VGL06_06975 [Pseudonocardiaceae bacterium]